MTFSMSSDDLAFKQQFESCDYPASEFDHQAHVRLAYLYLVQHDADSAVALMRQSIGRFLEHNGVSPTKYHETLTRAWVLAVRHFMTRTVDCESADTFLARHPELLDKNILLTHYSAEVLFSERARQAFVEPDREPIPGHSDPSGVDHADSGANPTGTH